MRHASADRIDGQPDLLDTVKKSSDSPEFVLESTT